MTDKNTIFIVKPNKSLHIGHLKPLEMSMAENNRCCLCINDITVNNANYENISNILENIKWLNYIPNKVAFISDFFKDIYEFAIKLIKAKLAYVDITTLKEIRKTYHDNELPKNREKSIDHNLSEFENMKDGTLKNAVLRFKYQLKSENKNIFDPIIYSSQFFIHYKTGNSWNIYPEDDFAKVVISTKLNLSDIYFRKKSVDKKGLIDYWYRLLEFSPPHIHWFDTITIKNNILPIKLIEKLLIKPSFIQDIDDPRLFTIAALRRRGLTAEILRSFAQKMDRLIDPKEVYEHSINFFERDVMRSISVIQPKKVIIDNFVDRYKTKWITVTKNNHPINKSGEHSFKYSEEIYVDKRDENLILKGQIVKLKYMDCIKFSNVDKQNVTHVILTSDEQNCMCSIHWLAENEAKTTKFIYLDNIFDEEDEYNQTSMIEYIGYTENYSNIFRFNTVKFEGLGFFVYDKKLRAWVCTVPYNK